MNQPQLTDLHEKLARLAGHWQGEETMYPPDQPAGMQVQSVVQSRVELGGWFLLMGYAQLQDGAATYSAHGVMGCDHEGQHVTLHWFDSQGWNPVEPFRGKWDGDVLQLNCQSENGHDRLTYELQGDDAYFTRVENSADGETWKTLIEGAYRRTSTVG